MANFKLLLKKNILEMWRNKRILIFGLAFLAISLISALSAKFLPVIFEMLMDTIEGETSGAFGDLFLKDSTVADSYVQYIANIGEIAIILIILMFATAITKEKVKGTYDFLKMNKVKDKEIVLARFTSQVIMITISYLLSVALFVLLNILLFKQIMGIRGVVTLTYIYILLLFFTSLTLFLSCLCKKNIHSYVFVVLAYFGLNFIEIIPKLNYINPLHLLSLGNTLTLSSTYSLSEHLITSIASVILCGVLVIGSLKIVKNRINNRQEKHPTNI